MKPAPDRVLRWLDARRLRGGQAIVDQALQFNLRRLGWAACFLVLLGVVHVLVFRGGDLPADPAVRAWRQAIVTLHTVLVGVASALGLAVLAVEPRRGPGWAPWRRAVEVCGCVAGLALAIGLVAADQRVTPSITPFLIACVLTGTLMLLRPVFALPLFAAAGAAFWHAMGLAQPDPVLRLTNRVNGLTAAAIGLLLAVVFWRHHVRHRVLLDELAAQRERLLRQQADLARLALSDPLTGLVNRAEIRRRALDVLAADAAAGRPTAFVALDLDHFKRINDTWGHPVGDSVLIAVAGVLRGQVRADDPVGRLGGEEFLVVLPGASAEEAEARAERLRQSVADVAIPGVPGGVTASFGVASATAAGSQDAAARYDALYAAADAALYAAKRDGRDRVRRAG